MNKEKEPQLTVDKIDVDDLIKDFKVLNIDNFSAYLKEVWRVNKKIIFRIYLREATIRIKESIKSHSLRYIVMII